MELKLPKSLLSISVLAAVIGNADAQAISFQNIKPVLDSVTNPVWDLGTVAPGVTGTLTLNGFYGTGGKIKSEAGNYIVYADTATVNSFSGLPRVDSLAMAFQGVETNYSGMDFTISFSSPITTTFAVLDMDTSANGVVETVAINSAAVDSYELGSEITYGGSVDGYEWFTGSTDATYANASGADKVLGPDVTTEFDVVNQSSINFRWEISRDTVGTNSRTFSLASTSTIPEPSSSLLVLLGGAGFVFRRKK